MRSAQKHLAGQGCPRCKIEELIDKNVLVGGYSKDLFDKKPELKNKKCTLYYLKINHFYKIGITTSKISDRIKALKAKANANGEKIECKILYSKEGSLYDMFLLEQKILNENQNVRIFKKWSTELFKTNIIEKII